MKNQYIATVIDTTGIQPYIFGSNRLRENIGASYLVEQVTNEWVKCLLRQEFKNNVYIYESAKEDKCIEQDNLDAELVYAGGGNAVIIFKDKKSAIDFTNKLSEKVLWEAPGLKIVVAHSELFEWGNKLSEIVDTLMKQLEQKKREYNPSVPLLGLGVTASCLSTGLVAVDTSDRYNVPNSYLVSREIAEKLRVVDSEKGNLANKLLENTIFKELNLGEYQVPYDVDDLGRNDGISSYMAIVHADGNGIGDRFKDYAKDKSDREYINAIRDLSQKINRAGINALKAVADRVIKLSDGQLQQQFNITVREGKKYLPFRPIVYGGDDVTFICDGRLGLTLAALYLKEFEAQFQTQKISGKPLTACAGIAIVKTHYPFARAYQLSEALCRNAKNFVRDEKKRLRCPDFSAFDWHIAASGLLGSIGEIRQQEYQVSEGNLSIRPVYLHSNSDWRNWDNFSEIVDKFNNHPDWSGCHNKLIRLREYLRQGADKTKQFLKTNCFNENYLPIFIKARNDDFHKSGWIDDPREDKRICGYFDAIEAMEFHIPLQEKTSGDLLSENVTSQ